jgi:hypothetical protein
VRADCPHGRGRRGPRDRRRGRLSRSGYVIAKEERFRQPWNDARAAFPAQARTLERLAADNPDELRQVRRIVHDAERYIREYETPLVSAASRRRTRGSSGSRAEPLAGNRACAHPNATDATPLPASRSLRTPVSERAPLPVAVMSRDGRRATLSSRAKSPAPVKEIEMSRVSPARQVGQPQWAGRGGSEGRRPPGEPVTSPDQRKPGSRKLGYVGVLLCAALLLLLLLPDRPNDVEIAWAGGCSAALLIAVGVDWQLRRRGLRS